MKNPRTILASYFTLAGNVKPLTGVTVSPLQFRERVEVAAAVGYRAMGLFDSDLLDITERYGAGTIRAILNDNGLDAPEIELQSWPWYAPTPEAERMIDAFLQRVAQIGCRHIKVGGAVAPPRSIDRMAESFASLCDRAREVGTRVALEMVPFSNVADLATACEIVNEAGRLNGGHMVDSWHVFRGRQSLADVAALPGSRIFGVEMEDAATQVKGSLLEDTVNHRCFSGEGDFDLVGFIQAVDATGYTGPIGVELLSDQIRQMPLRAVAQKAFDTTRSILDLVDRVPPQPSQLREDLSF